jgi:hypothetical protein
MKIISLKAQNFKRLEAIEIRPEESGITLISGNNDQGKSSAIEAIIAALKYTELNLKQPIREGQDRAEVIVELDSLIVERVWTANDKSYLKVKTKDGATYPSPQAILDKLINTLTLDPLEFINLKPVEQVDALLRIVKFEEDPVKLDSRIAELYEERRMINRDFEKFKRILEELPEPELNLPSQPIDVRLFDVKRVELYDKKSVLSKHKALITSEEKRLDSHTKGISIIDQRIKSLIDQIELQKKDRDELVLSAKASEMLLENMNRALDDMTPLEEIEKSMAELEQQKFEAGRTNEKIKSLQNRQLIENERDEAFQKSQELTGEIEDTRKRKTDMLSKAEFPIEGLGFDENGVTYNGIPFNQASGSDQLRVSLAIAMSMNPELRVIFSKHGDVFDNQKLKVIEEFVAEKDYQLWLERIYPSLDVPFVQIEDGKIVEKAEQGS